MQLLEVLTVGFPFCCFKILTGLYIGGVAGALFVFLGVVDFFINAVNFSSLAVMRRKITESCLLSIITARLDYKKATREQMHDFGNSLDMLLAFLLVAYMVGFSQLVQLSENHSTFWSISVVLNVLGAGLSRLTKTLDNLKRS
jgi:hypothetical protein